MGDMREIKALMRLLGEPPRLAIVDAITRSPGIDARRIASGLSLEECDVEPHLNVLHEAGVLACEDDGWSLSPRVKTWADGQFLRVSAKTRDGHSLQLRFARADSL